VHNVAQVTKPYIFANQTTADATQVNADFDTLYNLVNGNLDDTNIKDGSLSTAIATEGVSQIQTKGVVYTQDLFGSGCILSGLAVTKDGTNANKINVTAGVVYIKQADGSLRRFAPSAVSFTTTTPNNTYNLDFQPDGTWFWGVGHSTQANYINVATVTSDASSNVNVITTNPNAYTNVLTTSDRNTRTFVHYNQNSGQSIPQSAWTTMLFQNKVQDNNNNFNSSTGVFTAPKAGIYVCTASVMYTAAPGTAYAAWYVNGGSNRRAGVYQGAQNINSSAVIQLNANDQLTFQVNVTSSATTTGSADGNWISIIQIA
jgi:hypothetical protein